MTLRRRETGIVGSVLNVTLGFTLWAIGSSRASAQLVNLYVDRIENAQSTDIEGRDEVYFLLIGSSSAGKPVYIRAPKAGAKVDASLGAQDYYGLSPNTHTFIQWFHGGGDLTLDALRSGREVPITGPSSEPSATSNLVVGTVHLPPDGYFLGCLLIAEQDNAELGTLASFLLGLGGNILGAVAGGVGGEFGKWLFPGTPVTERKKLRVLEHVSENELGLKLVTWNSNCSAYAAQIREAKHQVIGAISFALAFTTEGKLLTHWDATPATQTMLLTSTSADVTAVATGHRAVYGLKVRSEPAKLVSLKFRHSDKCLDVPGASQSNSDVQQFACGDALSQKWHLETVLVNQVGVRGRFLDPQFGTFIGIIPSMAYIIRAAHSNKCLDVVDAETNAVRHQVRQYDCHYGPAQLWVPEPQAYVPASLQPELRLRALSSWKCLDVAGVSMNNNASVGTFACKKASDATKGNQILIRQ
jgi:hypothetical protein